MKICHGVTTPFCTITSPLLQRLRFVKNILTIVMWPCLEPLAALLTLKTVDERPFDFPQLLTNHYERCWKYYCLVGGWGNFGAASDEELHLSRKLFWGIFDALSYKVRL